MFETEWAFINKHSITFGLILSSLSILYFKSGIITFLKSLLSGILNNFV